MNPCQVDTKKYLTEHSDKVAKSKSAKYAAPMTAIKFGDRIEYTYTGDKSYSAALGLYQSFNTAFPGIINRPRSVQNNHVVTIPIDINTVNRVIELAARSRSKKAEVAPEYRLTSEDAALLDYMEKNSDTLLKDTDPYNTKTSLETVKVLDNIIEKGNTPGLRALARDMKKLVEATQKTSDLGDLGIFFVDADTMNAASPLREKNTLGLYTGSSNTIYLLDTLTTNQAHKVFLHELAHAITERKIQSDPEIRKEFEKLYDVAKEALKDNPNIDPYRLSNVSEFIAGAFNDKNFMAALARIESVNKKAPSILVEFMNLVKKILGLQDLTLLDDVLYLVEKTSMSNTPIDMYATYSPRAEFSQEDIINDFPNVKKLWEKQVESIRNRIKELTPLSGGSERQEVRRRISILNNSLRDLEGRISYDTLISVAKRDLQTANYLLSKSDINAFDINEALRILEDLEGFDSALEESLLTAEFKAEKTEIRNEVNRLGVTFRKKFANEVMKIAKAQGYDITYEQLTKAVKDMNKAEKLYYDSEYSHIPIMRVASAVLSAYKNNVKDSILEFEAKEAEIKQAFKNFNLNSLFENGHLIGEYTDEYYKQEDEKNNAVRDAFKPIRDLQNAGKEVPSSLWAAYYAAMNSRFKWYKDNNSYILTAENEEKYKKDFEVQKELLTVNGVVDYEALAQWEKDHSPYENEAGKLDSNGKFVFTSAKSPSRFSRWYSYFQVVPNENFNNPKYEQVKDNAVYNYFRNGFIEAFSKIPHQAFLDVGTFHKLIRSVEFDYSENSFRFRGLLSNMGDSAADWFTVKLTLDDVNGVDKSTRDAFGRPKTAIKVPNFNDVTNREKDPWDLLKTFYKMAVTYEHKVQAAPVADLLYYQLSNIPKLESTITGGMIKNIITGDPTVVQKGLMNAMENLRYKIDATLSEKTRLDEESVMELTPEEKDELEKRTLEWVNNGAKGPAPTIRKVSYVRTLDSIGDFTRLSLIGLKPFSAASNLLMGVASNYIYAARKKEFDDEHLTKAFKVMFQSMSSFWTGTATLGKARVITADAKKMTLLANKFGVVTNLYENQGQLGKTDVQKAFVELMYKFQESGEYLIHTQILMAMMYKQQVETAKGESKSLWDAYTLGKDSAGNDILVWNEKEFGAAPEWNNREVLDNSGLNVSKLNTFERSLKQVRIDTQGDYQNALLAKSNVWGRLYMVFRTWIPSAVRQRFGREIEGEFKGRYRSYVSYFKSNKGGKRGFLSSVKSLASISTKTALVAAAKTFNFGPFKYLGFSALSNKATELYEQDLEKLGLSEMDIENMRVNVRELQFILFFLILAGALKQLADDGDDPYLNFAANLAQRVYQDLSFFLVPGSALSVIKDPIPEFKTVQEAEDVIDALSTYLTSPEDDVYKRGKRKGQSKLVKNIGDILPISSAYYNTQAVMDQVLNSDTYKYAKNK